MFMILQFVRNVLTTCLKYNLNKAVLISIIFQIKISPKADVASKIVFGNMMTIISKYNRKFHFLKASAKSK